MRVSETANMVVSLKNIAVGVLMDVGASAGNRSYKMGARTLP